MAKPQTWSGSPPAECDLCDKPIATGFVDGKTNLGPWVIMCLSCHAHVGVGLGTGRGQRYRRELDEHGEVVWVKTEG